MDDVKIEELDLYELLEIDVSSSVNEIKKAYRKKALQCHPDKNPDDPNAAKKFHQLSKFLEILTDENARAAYDKVLKGRKQALIRHKELDSKRQKLKEDLEFREKKANSQFKEKSADLKLKEEIERLRKEGSKLVEEEINYVNKKLAEESSNNSGGSLCRIKIKWNSSKSDTTNGGYNQQLLFNIMSKYGDIQALVLSPNKKGRGLVEFKEQSAAELAVQLEIGMPENPLKLEWLNGPPPSTRTPSNLLKESDFESITLTRLRQAEERKRLIQQMMNEDNEET